MQTHVDLIGQLARDPDCDPGKLQALLDVKEQWEANEARKAYARALVEFQSRCPIITPGDRANGRPYARIDRIWRETRSLRDELGLAVQWSTFALEDGRAVLTGKLWHRSGHCEDVRQEINLPDRIKGQNDAQVSGSAETYAKRYATCAALGIIIGDDDDGNKAGAGPVISPEQAAEFRKMCDVLGAGPTKRMLAFAGVADIAEIPADKYATIRQTLNAKIDALEDGGNS